ncbi:MAG: Dabb family protein [Planctomycetota bacterium]
MAAFLHTVHFWLKRELSDQQRAEFVSGVKRLADSPSVAKVRVGVPAHTPRDVVDNTYDVQLVCEFDSREAHEAYQSSEDEVHAAFVDGFKDCWERVLIYDSLRA